jgi:hypothetical protein
LRAEEKAIKTADPKRDVFNSDHFSTDDKKGIEHDERVFQNIEVTLVHQVTCSFCTIQSLVGRKSCTDLRQRRRRLLNDEINRDVLFLVDYTNVEFCDESAKLSYDQACC